MRHALSVLVALALVGAASHPAFAARKNWGLVVGTYALDAKGRCHDQSGKIVNTDLCKTPGKQCRDPKTGYAIKCAIPKP